MEGWKTGRRDWKDNRGTSEFVDKYQRRNGGQCPPYKTVGNLGFYIHAAPMEQRIEVGPFN